MKSLKLVAAIILSDEWGEWARSMRRLRVSRRYAMNKQVATVESENDGVKEWMDGCSPRLMS